MILKRILPLFVLFCAAPIFGEEPPAATTLFDGSSLDAFDYTEGGWSIEEDGSVICNMMEVKDKAGKTKLKGMGYLWTKSEYSDFELTLDYRLSEGANSGVFYRTEKDNSVHMGFEVQLMDNVGFQKTHGKKEPRKLNGSFYEGKAPSANPANPVGEWDSLTLKAVGPRVVCHINGVEVFDVDVNDWPEIGKNPDGTPNKFKVAIKDKPRSGFIGFQNHGQVVWFRNIKITDLSK